MPPIYWWLMASFGNVCEYYGLLDSSLIIHLSINQLADSSDHYGTYPAIDRSFKFDLFLSVHASILPQDCSSSTWMLSLNGEKRRIGEQGQRGYEKQGFKRRGRKLTGKWNWENESIEESWCERTQHLECRGEKDTLKVDPWRGKELTWLEDHRIGGDD